MDLFSIAVTLWRHKVAVLVVTVLTVLGSVITLVTLPSVYESTATVLLVPPPRAPADDSEAGADNPYTRAYDASIVINVVAAAVTADPARENLMAQGADRRYDVAQTVRYGFASPVAEIVGSGSSPREAKRTAELVVAAFQEQLRAIQAAEDVDERYFIATRVVDPADPGVLRASGKLRALIAVMGLGFVALFAVVTISDALAKWRAERDGSDRPLPDAAGAPQPIPAEPKPAAHTERAPPRPGPERDGAAPRVTAGATAPPAPAGDALAVPGPPSPPLPPSSPTATTPPRATPTAARRPQPAPAPSGFSTPAAASLPEPPSPRRPESPSPPGRSELPATSVNGGAAAERPPSADRAATQAGAPPAAAQATPPPAAAIPSPPSPSIPVPPDVAAGTAADAGPTPPAERPGAALGPSRSDGVDRPGGGAEDGRQPLAVAWVKRSSPDAEPAAAANGSDHGHVRSAAHADEPASEGPGTTAASTAPGATGGPGPGGGPGPAAAADAETAPAEADADTAPAPERDTGPTGAAPGPGEHEGEGRPPDQPRWRPHPAVAARVPPAER